MKTKSGIEYKFDTSKITIDERAELSQASFDKGIIQGMLGYCRKCLTEIDGIKTTEKNINEVLMSISNNDWLEIGGKIATEINFPVKKKILTILNIWNSYKGSWFGKEQQRKDKAGRIRRDIEPLIREYYNIDDYEKMLIEDTLQLAKESFHPRLSDMSIPTLRHPEDKDCIIYAQTLCEMLNNFGRNSRFKVKGDIIKGRPYSVVHIAMTDRASRTIPVSTADEKLAKIFNRMRTLLQHEQGRFVFCQNLKVFDGDSLYILKPMQMRFWSRTAALNDADEVAGSIIQSQRGH